MKKFLLMTLVCLSLSACMTPQYHKSTQNLPVEMPARSTLPVKAWVNGEQVPVRVTRNGQFYIQLNRDFADKEILLRQGNMVQEIQLKSVWTKDKWARFNNYTDSVDESAALLFTPANALSMGGFFLKETFNPDSGRSWYGRIGTFIAAPLAVIAGVPLDIYNWIIGGPSTPFINPWREYRVESIRSWRIEQPKPQPVFYENYFIQYTIPLPQINCCIQ